MPARAAAASFEARPYRLPLKFPLRTSRGEQRLREGFLVVARDGALSGRGEAAPIDGTESLDEALAQLRAARFDRLPETPAARYAAELALLDLEAQRRGLPLARLLHPRAPLEVRASALLSAQALPDLAREARALVQDGFGTLKLKVGFADDFARAAAVRDAAGPSVQLRIDANGAWDAKTALRRLRELAPLGIELCEQPTTDLLGLENRPLPIAADELVARDLDASLARADLLVLKPTLLGGLLRCLEAARRARERGRAVIVTTALEGAIGRAGVAHLAAAILADGPQPAAGLATGRLLAEDLCEDSLVPSAGVVRIPLVAGLGLP